MDPCPIGRGLSLKPHLCIHRLSRSRYFQRKNLGTLRLVPSSLPREEFCWERIEIIGSGTVSPTVGKAFRGVKKNTLLLLEFKERAEECLGTKGHPWSEKTTSPTSGASD